MVNDPVNRFDPKGLWNYLGYCRNIAGGELFGVSVFKCQIYGPCINNQRTIWITRTLFFGLTA